MDPWGKIVVDSGHEEKILYCDVDLEEVRKVRSQLPYLDQRRVDMYEL